MLTQRVRVILLRLLNYIIFYHFFIVVAAMMSAKTSTTHCHTLVQTTRGNEAFSLRTYRYFGADEGAEVYIHCDFRVCLADVPDTRCECPDDPNTCVGDPVTDIAPVRRRRRSISDSVDESQLYHVVYGPFTFKQEELNKDEGK